VGDIDELSNWKRYTILEKRNKTTLLSPPLMTLGHIVLCPDSKDDDYAIEVDLTFSGEVLNNQLIRKPV